ncbi:HAD-IIIA family hydrolase [Patescibacteria group bacterium]|nr:HAD-IIIA family hydrolase [Patescibacteria group bacterium]
MKNVRVKKIAFLDRDGVINVNAPPHEYITSVSDFVFNQGIFNVLKTLARDGFEFIVVTNQQGVARGKMTLASLTAIHDHMITGLKEHGITILDVFYCPHLDGTCDCRKPNDGLLRQAAAKYPIDTARSILIGDSQTDIDAGRKFGLAQTILISTDHPEEVLTQYTPSKIKIAFVKYGGMSAGGTEKMLQIIAANLDKTRFDVDYYYCNASPFRGITYNYPDTDPFRLAYMKAHNVNLVPFTVGEVNMVNPYQTWHGTDFWEKFDETKYDVIQTGRPGHPEYPFTKIKRTPILEIIALKAGCDNQYNIARSLHICQWSADQWIKSGGDSKRVRIISLPIDIETRDYGTYRSELSLDNKFIYGMHQRASDSIFSPFPLAAYKKIENENTWFIMLGGSTLYQKQALELGIKNITFLPTTGDSEIIFKFLSTLNVYAHGRKDGEVNSQAMAEGMYFGLPIVSHVSEINNGHIECIGTGGKVLKTIDEYAAELTKLRQDTTYYTETSQNARQRFTDHYELTNQIKRFEEIYIDVVANPFPHPLRRVLYKLHYTQNIRIVAKAIYRQVRFWLGK